MTTVEPLTIPLSSIVFGTRARASYDKIEDLMSSILDRGLIQPLVINRTHAQTYHLVAGGRRYKALELAGIKEVTQGLSSVPGRAGFVFLDDLPASELLEIELEENLFRADLRWQDRAILTYKIHKAKVIQNSIEGKAWGQRQTGELLGASRGDVSHCCQVAEVLLKEPKAFEGCLSVFDAMRVMYSRRTDAALKLQVRNSHSPNTSSGQTDISSFFTDDDDDEPIDLPTAPSAPAQLMSATSSKVTVVLAKQFKHGDTLEILESLPDNSFDHIVTDPPYGIDLEFMDLRGQERVEATHEVEPNIQLLESFIHKAFRVLRDNGFFVMWYDLDHHEKIQAWGKSVGFKVQRWPFVWHKEHPCRNQAPAYNFTKNFEVACIMRKGNATLLQPQTSSVLCADGSVEKKLYDNPFAKPFAVWKTLISAVAHKGQSILDPFMGGGSCCRAAINLGMMPYGFEIDERHYNQAIVTAKEAYKLLLQDGVEFK